MDRKSLFDEYLKRLHDSRTELREAGAPQDIWRTPKNRFVNERIFSQWVHSISQAESYNEAIRISGLPFDAVGLILVLLREQEECDSTIRQHSESSIRTRTSRVLRRHSENRPIVNKDLEQQTCSIPSLVSKAIHIHRTLPCSQRRILCLGDDDLASVPLALLGFEVDVLDRDSRLVTYMNHIAKVENLDINARVYDIRNALPSKFVGAYDAFTCDPCQNLGGVKSFITRGAQSLVSEEGTMGFVNLFAWTLGSYLKPIQEYTLAIGFRIIDYQRNFTGYPLAKEAISYCRQSENSPIRESSISQRIATKVQAEYSDLMTIQLAHPNSKALRYWLSRKIGTDIYYVGASI